jgi:hypothetical protein
MKCVTGRPTKIAASLGCVALALCFAMASGGCRRRAPRSSGAGSQSADGGVSCPANEELARRLAEPGRTVRAQCLLFAPGYYWLGAALSYDAKGAAPPRLQYLSGGYSTRAYEIEPAPVEALAALIKSSNEVEVQIRKGRGESRLVRLGVVGRRAGGESSEVGMVLQLVAHKQPQVLWTGAGDERRRAPDGCVVDRHVDFSMPFGDRLEMVTTFSAPGGCATPPASQQAVDYRAVSIKPGRPLP